MAEGIQDAVKTALTNHPSVDAALANQKAVKYERKEMVAGYYPDLNLRAAGGRIFANNSTSRGTLTTRASTYSNLLEGGVTFTQPLFTGFETSNRVSAAEKRLESARFNVVDVRENLALRTTIAYLDVLRSQDILTEIDAYDDRLGDYIGRIEALVAEGAADQSFLTRAVDLRAEIKNTSANIRSALRTAKAEYAEFTGRQPIIESMKTPYPPLDYVPTDLEDAVAYAKEHHPFLKSAEFQQDALHDTAEADKQFYYPDFDGELSYFERDQDEDIGGELVDARALLRMTWDISLGGSNSARYKQSMHRHLEAKSRWLDSQRQIERQLRVAYSDMIRTQEQLDVQNERFRIAEELFTNYSNQFEGARIDIFQVIQADNDLYSTKLAVLNGKYALIVTQYGVLASMGRLQEALGVQGTEFKGDN